MFSFNLFILGPSSLLQKGGATRAEFIGLQLSRPLSKNVGCIYKETLRNETKKASGALAWFDWLSHLLFATVPLVCSSSGVCYTGSFSIPNLRCFHVQWEGGSLFCFLYLNVPHKKIHDAVISGAECF